MTAVGVYNEWSPLKSVILGLAAEMYFHAPGTLISRETSPLWLRWVDQLTGAVLKGRRVPRPMVKKFAAELDTLLGVLRGAGVEVVRPRPVSPTKDEPLGLTQVFPRDPIIAAGDRLLCGRQKLPALRKEIRGFSDILAAAKKTGAAVPDLSVEPAGAFLEGGDVLVDYPYLFVGVGDLATNAEGAAWLARQVEGQFKVVPVPITGAGIFHLDTCMTLIGPGRGILCRSALASPLPEPLNRYEFIEVDEKIRRQIGTNILMLNPETVVVQNRHTALQKALRDRHFRVVPVNFSWHALSGGAFRCATHPLQRDWAPSHEQNTSREKQKV